MSELTSVQKSFLDNLGIDLEQITDQDAADQIKASLVTKISGHTINSYTEQIKDLQTKHKNEMQTADRLTPEVSRKIRAYENALAIDRYTASLSPTHEELALAKELIGTDRYKVLEGGTIIPKGSNSDLSFMGKNFHSVKALVNEIRTKIAPSSSETGKPRLVAHSGKYSSLTPEGQANMEYMERLLNDRS